MIRYTEGCLSDHKYNISTEIKHVKQKNKVKKPYEKSVCYDIFTFDIEVTSAWLDHGEIVGYTPGISEDDYNKMDPVSLCYIWMFGINDQVYYGRELSEFRLLLQELPEAELIIYIHNLAYEFHFLVDIIQFKTIFAKTPHKPMKCIPAEFPYIEFRCSYMLSNMSLDKWGKQLGIEKKTGDLDYLKKIRTPLTRLTKKELTYCEYDILVLYAGIKKELETYQNVFNIPLTSTGKIRRVIKDILFKIPGYMNFIKRMVPDKKIYLLLRELFAGGYTHANRLYAGRVIRGEIEHRDVASEYPTAMCAFKYPMGKWVYRTDRYIPKDVTYEKYAFIFIIRFTNIRSVNINTYIQKSKCRELKNPIMDNGRVIAADSLTMVMTNYDWMIIRDHYEWDEYTLLDSWYARTDYLPKKFIRYILKLYGNKTSLKDVSGSEDIYNQSKAFINSCYGMMVTDIVQSDVKYDENTGKWYIEFLTEETLEKKLSALANRYHVRDKRYFVSYSWGCFVTAHARYMLWKCMDMCTDDPAVPGKDVLYVDTDSIYGRGYHDYSKYNDWIVGKLDKMCRHYSLDPELTRPKNPDGKQCQLGIFEDEHDNISEFISLHAKCYCFRGMKKKDKKPRLYLTVAGINKEAVDVLNDDIENFDYGLPFDKDHPSVKKNMHTYISDMPDIIWPDGYHSSCRSGINIRPTGYTIQHNDPYERMIEFCQSQFEDIDDITLNKLKGTLFNG